MKLQWWKILSVLILLYVIIAGLAVPLKPGIDSVEPNRVAAGDRLVLEIEGYNTDFFRAEDNRRAWLKLDDTYSIRADELLARSERRLLAGFEIPAVSPVAGGRQAFSVVLDDAYHGAIVIPSSVHVSGFGQISGDAGWVKNDIQELHALDRMVYPYRSILYETIRNTYFHVPMWFGMIILFFGSAWFAIRYVAYGDIADDQKSLSLVTTGTVFGLLGILTGMLWSNYTWGAPWSFDVKQNTAAIALLIYLAYFILRKSFDDHQRKARVSAVYNIFGCAMIIPLLFIIPRMTDSLHPGSGGNPALGGEDLDNTMRLVFYPAVIGWTLLGVWISEVLYRYFRLQKRFSI